MFHLAVITTPESLPHEEEALCLASHMEGVFSLHLRKPAWNAEQLRQLLLRLPKNVRKKIRLHSHFELCTEFELQGVHLNLRCPVPPENAASVSASCHTLNEVLKQKASCRYVFLSPVFNSISKQGYASAFSEQALRTAAKQNIIDNTVFALGGVETANIAWLKDLGFGGAGVIGAVWQHYAAHPDLKAFEKNLQNILKACI